ncbi:SDR family oxidoreductase [Terriglobus saanensis]|uniref:Short-chain dehydrogenase/reductase SDR n=1 Tax=Terriglobus saanensis (strain ATCC BAA-1853 / DSM 23119 / SP1PR4) TaxID=401053 RepID=E8V8N4_TERSS|nr:SDR family oxidoreductase [Terriglobus saanensis]ADV84071.1 short-chain dehydrogenase/reductase SDR [Terriglobus saanensis SP1PR4]
MPTPRKILILGATSAIAEQTARVWAKRGDSLYLVARNPQKLAVVAADLKTRGASFVESIVADLDDLDLHPQLLADAITALGGLDIAYLAHGVLGDQAEAEADAIAAEQILHTNFTSPVSLLTWLANFCVKQHSGTLAVISSVAGDRGRKSNYVYGSAKAGLSAFLSGLRNRIDREGVTVTTIKPGPVKTSMTAGMKGSEKFADPAKVGKAIASAIDSKRDQIYVPFQWRVIMAVIRHIPESIFKKTNT